MIKSLQLVNYGGKRENDCSPALYRLNDPVFAAALSPRDRSSISEPVADFCRDQETEMSSKEEEEGSGNHHNWPGTN